MSWSTARGSAAADRLDGEYFDARDETPLGNRPIRERFIAAGVIVPDDARMRRMAGRRAILRLDELGVQEAARAILRPFGASRVRQREIAAGVDAHPRVAAAVARLLGGAGRWR